ncbi:NAD-dependent epimerase/dehydratase family protein [Brevibacillus fulvus]|uniref:Nucleoside-diphosphate-sugar epimerase n=1 Tax=Brevibacillus fulvus TaxID=1125967 RepID=A0A938Y4K1_9BACL|nr:NAD-dependent epimerase/dehydratase family protein [Brevibacillus fulvus]MBM7591115.1 nucleoside-diphosphate-sugar epimerase [Brevibacillus fulvus]
MKKALVLGATGSMGYALVQELVKRNVEVTAFARGEERLRAFFANQNGVTLFPGDMFHPDSLDQAAADADVIFHAVNLPYGQWEQKLPLLTDRLLAAAQATGAKLVVVDNVYAYGRSNGQKVTEETPKQPASKKGKIRLQLEQTIKQSAVPALIAHFPDFYGPHAGNTLLHYTMQGILSGKKAYFVGNQQIEREYIYTPDGAKALVELALHDFAYGQNWNIPGSGVISGAEIIRILREASGYRRRVGTVTKPMLRFLGLFDKMMSEMVEMMYLTEQPVILSGEKYEKFIGKVPMTAYRDGILQTWNWMTARR